MSQSISIPSTSPTANEDIVDVQELTVNALAGDVITFSEYPLGTAISNQYAEQGIIFGGDNPFISLDAANPTAPVLSGTPRFQGSIEGIFVDPSDGETPAIVQSFSLDAGYFDALGSTRIEWFDPDGNKLGQRTNTKYSIERFNIEGGNIARWRIAIIENEPAGYAIDNVSFEPVQASVLFREKSDGEKDESWGFIDDEIPGFDHSALNVDNVVYESHPYYPSGIYYSQDGQETAVIVAEDGVQAQHTKETFKHDAKLPGAENSPVIDFEEIPITKELAESMRNHIETQLGATFQHINIKTLEGIEQTLSPSAQKGGDGTFTCVGLIEWAAEQADHRGGQGFIRNAFESISYLDPTTFPPEIREFPLLSPHFLNYAMKTSLTLENIIQWFHGIFDPVNFMITDPLGRRLGYTVELGEINEIPNAFYSGNGDIQQFFIPNPVAGTYQIEFIGLGMHVYGAMSSSSNSEGINIDLAQGENLIDTFNVELMAGAPGDVNFDGKINEEDIANLSALLNTFTNDPNDPGDIDGDGKIGQSDLNLLNELINVSNQEPPIANAGPDQSGSATGINPTIQLPIGTFTITLVVNDGTVDSDPDTVEITVIDDTPPELSVSVSPDTLWPANHKMVPVSLDVSVSDNCDANPDIVLTSVVSNEPDDAPGGGDGHTTNDIQDADIGTEDYNISLRAERQGKRDGRIYTITYTATDDSNNSRQASVEIIVPHDRGKKK
jgi:hypothetical protein